MVAKSETHIHRYPCLPVALTAAAAVTDAIFANRFTAFPLVVRRGRFVGWFTAQITEWFFHVSGAFTPSISFTCFQ